MASKINALTGSGGVAIEGDSSGILEFQSNGTTIMTVSSASQTALNKIINGDMRVDQRDATITPTTSDDFCVDRWSGREETDGAISMEQSTDAPAGFVNSLKVTVTTADASIASGQFTRIAQPIEGYNIADLNWGTADAQSVTLSFWIKSSVTGNFYGGIRNSAGNRAYVFSYSVSSASTWEKKTITIAGDTTGTWLTDNNKGIWLLYSIGTGSDYQGTAGAWQAANVWSASGDNGVMGTLNATWQLTGVQLEAGGSASNFEYLQFGQQLELCQRYFCKSYNIEDAVGSNTWVGTANIRNYDTTARSSHPIMEQFPVFMRATPVLVSYSKAGTSGKCTTGSGSFDLSGTEVACTLAGSERNIRGATVTVGSLNMCQFHFTADAEL